MIRSVESATFDKILEERIKVRKYKGIKMFVLSDNDHRVLSLSSTASPTIKKDNEVKSKNNDEAEVSTELQMLWLNDDTRYKISKTELDDFVSVIKDKFLLLQWRRNLTRNFCQRMKKKTVVHFKHKRKKKKYELVTNKYVVSFVDER